MKTKLIVTTAVLALGLGACSKSEDKTGTTSAAKTAAGDPAKGEVMTAKALWDLAQSDDSQMRKSFTVQGKIEVVEDTRVDIVVGDGQSLKLFFADADAAKKAGQPGASVTASCTLVGTTPRSVRLETCTTR